MNENKYIEKFQKKTDTELEFIIENKEKYNDIRFIINLNEIKKHIKCYVFFNFNLN